MTWFHHSRSAALACSIAALFLSVASSAAAAPRLKAEGGLLLVHADTGTVLRGQDLKGTVVRLRDRSGRHFELRFDAVEPGPFGDVELYDVAIRSHAEGAWTSLCRPGPDGRARLLAIETENARDQSDTDSIAHVSFACTAGAKGKCILRGYRPWATSAAGTRLAPYFDACIRMMRADYCGNGRSYTQEGIRIESWDNLGIRTSDRSLPFESAWDSNGAICISRTRVPSVATLSTLVNHCPALAARVRPDCSDRPGQPGGAALLWNSSDSAR